MNVLTYSLINLINLSNIKEHLFLFVVSVSESRGPAWTVPRGGRF